MSAEETWDDRFYAATGLVLSAPVADLVRAFVATETSQEVEAAVEDEERNPWKRAVVEAMILLHTLPQADETPRAALNRLICAEQQIALDPAVSTAAVELVTRGMERAAAMTDCGCPEERKAAVLQCSPNSGARWALCGASTCGALEASDIRDEARRLAAEPERLEQA